MMKYLYTLLLITICIVSQAQQFDWQKRFYPIADYERAYKLLNVSTGGYLIIGSQDFVSTIVSNSLLIRTDANGDTLWTSTHSVPELRDHQYGELIEDSLGNFIGFFNAYNSSPGPLNIESMLTKYSSFGDTLWTKKVFGPGYEVFNQIERTHDGNFLLMGTVADTNQLIKIDGDGNILDRKLIIYNDTIKGTGYQLTKTNTGYLLYVNPPNSWVNGLPTKVYHLDANADTLSSSKSFIRNPYRSIYTSDNHVLVAGGALFKLTASGDTVWSKRLYNYGGQYGTGIHGVVEDADHTYIGIGYTSTSFGYFDIAVVKIDTHGTVLNYVLLMAVSNEWPRDITLSPDGDYILYGHSDDFGGANNRDIFLAEMKRWAYLDAPAELKAPITGPVAYPNPASDFIEFAGTTPLTGLLTFQDISGKSIRTQLVSNQSYVRFSLSDIPQGLYVLRYKGANGYSRSYKIVKE